MYIILKYVSDIGFAGDYIRSTWDVKSKLARLVTCLGHYLTFVLDFDL
jgi:hypothetical protein